MKLIIDIPEEAKRHIDTFKGKFLCGDGFDLIEAIQNGTPLDDVKAEIKQLRSHSARFRRSDGSVAYADSQDILDILDNIGKAESEE